MFIQAYLFLELLFLCTSSCNKRNLESLETNTQLGFGKSQTQGLSQEEMHKRKLKTQKDPEQTITRIGEKTAVL